MSFSRRAAQPSAGPLADSIAILGVGSSSGKTVVSCGLLRHLSNVGRRAVPVKSVVVGHAVEDGVGWHCRAARVESHPWMTPLWLLPDSDGTGDLRTSTANLGRARCLSNDTVWLPDLPDHAMAVAERAVRDAARTAGSAAEMVVVEGSGAILDVVPDLANTTAALELGATVVLVANARRGGFASGLAGAHALLPRALRDRVLGYLITNVPVGIGLDTVGARIEEATGMRMLGIVGHIAGVTRDGPLPVEEAFDALARAVADTDLPDQVLRRDDRPRTGT